MIPVAKIVLFLFPNSVIYVNNKQNEKKNEMKDYLK